MTILNARINAVSGFGKTDPFCGVFEPSGFTLEGEAYGRGGKSIKLL